MKNIFRNILKRIKTRLRSEDFLPSWLSIVISPVYIVRSSLFEGIKSFSQRIEGEVLDFGCGSKPYESLFHKADNYVGVDIKVSGHSHEDSKVDFFYDGEKLPFPDNSFDSIVCFEVFEHVFNIDVLCEELSRVLKPKGLFLVTLPFVWEEHESPYDFARYSSYGISHILKRHNFEVIDFIKSTTNFLTISQLFIHNLSQNLLPKTRILGWLFRLIVIFPLNSIALLVNKILPKTNTLYCNNIVLCENLKTND